MVDDASPDGTQEIAKQLAGVYGDDRVVGSLLSCTVGPVEEGETAHHCQVLKPRAGKLGLG